MRGVRFPAYSAARQTLIPLGGYPGHPALPLCAYARDAVGACPCGTCPLTADSPCGAAAISSGSLHIAIAFGLVGLGSIPPEHSWLLLDLVLLS